MKVETHNHPTAISPFPASTGRRRNPRRRRDRPRRQAQGRPDRLHGVEPDAARCRRAWENARDAQPVAHRNPDDKPVVTGKPDRIASPLQIMIDGPLGGAAFNNEFGRANLGGYFRVYEQNVGGTVRGYHKPIMIAGGIGNIDGSHTHKDPLPAGTLLIQLGGPGASAWAAARPVRWRPARTPPISISTRCSAATRKWSVARRKSSTPAGSLATRTRSCRSTTLARAAFRTRSPNWSTALTVARVSTCAGAPGRVGPVAGRDLVQRVAGALRAGDRAEHLPRFHVRA
jgi:hypothetical protein